MDWLLPLYPWVKSLHVIAVITWMAGIFYLPRLFIYHMAEPVGSTTSETFKTMERRLLRAIMNPSMIAAWAMGLTLVATPGVIDWRAGWWHTKLLAVILMTAVHMHQAAGRSAFARDERPHTERYWRIANEVPSLLLIIIVVMVIARPF
ncbi:putative membrane protein [Humitalea rosea]|uniref:Protoporphyrinogen IX oxidase n=2 Tax=Humitalea rosea TaxID=990373 RepID=A0A2W7JF51_9PROT|nr:putative membrane protein [Humitalea rosea]